ncbi:hypothetical protein ABGB18_33575 [Nonomuraea sp. B12E4]|uniref:hypothetical protein n=1 Tax=Nonomuraea sp. B12E4 TaxID=3153564 RepID=UPI00325D790E
MDTAGAASRGRSTASPAASPAARAAWLLGNDQSPGGGQPSTGTTTRHGRSSSTTSFSASLST